ncbi:OmcA/MtrC family decaheme c-type cytochrome [bacterium]|nr:OmcA/MtrC family decaheme c-type cytochrome [bacterium]
MVPKRLAKPVAVVAAIAALLLVLPLVQAGNVEGFKTAWANAAAKAGGNPNAAVVSQSADLNFDGIVDEKDLLRLMAQWHTEGTVVTQPDPQEQVHGNIVDVSLPADNKPIITYSLLDGNGQPFDPATPGLSLRWTIARITTDGLTNNGTRYDNYIRNAAGQPTYDSGGTVTPLGNGQFTYKFKTALNITNPAETHVIGGQIEVRALGIASNPIYTFRPDGGVVSVTREVTITQTCNSCHDMLAFHGGGRREYGLCVLCHHPGPIDPESGNPIDMANMIHKIHRGANLPSVQSGTPYQIIGHNNSVNDYSKVVFPQDIRNCVVCHNGSQGVFHRQVPSRLACGACHDNIDWTQHMGGQATDAACRFCHQETGPEFGPSVAGAHTIPTKSTQLAGLKGEILEIQNAVPGSAPVVRFKLYNNAMQPIDINSLNRMAITMAGPTKDYEVYVTEVARGSARLVTETTGTYAYTFGTTIAATATGTYAFALEARTNPRELSAGKAHSSVRESLDNPIAYVDVEGGTPVPRREVIDYNKCMTCHEELVLHGANRVEYLYCVMCHNPLATDYSQRPAGTLPPSTIDFKTMIHKIHAGSHLTKGYKVYGFGQALHDYSEVHFPAVLNNCEKCHKPGTQFAPTPAGTINQIITATGLPSGAIVSNLGPTTAACTGCHDTDAAAAHAQSNTGSPSGVEACGVCHGQYRSEAVDVVHAQ